ncbi:DUF4352 domain-containing protein [Actinomadura sp. NPDC049382]|uniref:DUF4352 domain-containing protein n=1 Tax=Actinomadura sp. NPDC049382 TaxID=3158220 RepID=UPI00342DF8AA
MKKLIALAAVLGLALTGCAVPTEPEPVQPAEKGAAGGETTKATPKTVPVNLKAKRTAYEPGPISSGGKYTCVKVTVTNQTTKNLDINPFYFEVTDTGGTKRKAAVGEAEGEFDTMALAPKEKATGVVCAEGKFTPETVTFTKDGFGTNYRAQVAP